MVTYVIASKATQPFLPECQMLGEFLEQNCPDVSVQVVIKSNEDWGEYIDSVCRSYGFYERYCPFIFTLEGEPIGDGSDFIEHVRSRYCRASVQMLKEHQDNRQRDNLKQIEDLMRRRKQGMTLGEKIESHLQKVLKKNVVSHIGDSFFESVEEQGSLFQLRRTNLQRDDGRTLNIVDEIEVEEAEARRIQEEEEKKDMTFDQYREQFTAHIEGTASNEREAHESAGEEAEDPKKSQRQGTVSKKGSALNRTNSQFAGDNDSLEDRNVGLSKRSSKKSNLDASRYQSMSMAKTQSETFKFDLPPSCMVSMMKKVLVEKMAAKYFLASHPYPKIEGEMIIFKPKKADQTQGKDVIIYRDYSLRKRIETTPKGPFSDPFAAKKKKGATSQSKATEDTKEVEPEPNLQCLEVDIVEPLSREEWNNMIQVIEETQGLGWFQILPVGQKSSMPYQFNMIHILPQAKIPVDRLPLDVFIATQLANLRKKERSQGGNAHMTTAIAGRALTAREEQEEFAIQQGLFMIPEFQFDHAFYQLSPENLANDPATQLAEIYKRLADFLRLSTKPDTGITCIMTPRWIFVGILTQPYANAPNGNPVYLDGFDFSGLVSLQTTSETWPATAGLEDQTISVTQALANSTKVTPIIDEEEEVNANNVTGSLNVTA